MCPGRKIAARLELTIPLSQQQANARAVLVSGDNIHLAIAIEVADRHRRGVAAL